MEAESMKEAESMNVAESVNPVILGPRKPLFIVGSPEPRRLLSWY
jgi:hypothetical protein